MHAVLHGPCASSSNAGLGKLNVDDYRLVKRFRAPAIALRHDARIDDSRLLGTSSIRGISISNSSRSRSSARLLPRQIKQRLLLVA